MAEYQSPFEKLLAKAGPLTQTRHVSCFISGLRESIRIDVQANRPTTLTSGIGLARLYEARDLTHGKSTLKSGPQSASSATTNSSTTLVKRMTSEELNERKRKGLCFKCNDKFGPGHRCKKLFMIQAYFEGSDDDIDMEIEDTTEENPAISLHAITGMRGPETMRVQGSLQSEFNLFLFLLIQAVLTIS